MKNCTTLHNNLDCCGQITLDDVQTIKKNGYAVVLCARYDGEEKNQPLSADIAMSMKNEQIEFIYLPFSNIDREPETAQQFCKLCAEHSSSKKTLAYCRTGRRILQAWQRSQQK